MITSDGRGWSTRNFTHSTSRTGGAHKCQRLRSYRALLHNVWPTLLTRATLETVENTAGQIKPRGGAPNHHELPPQIWTSTQTAIRFYKFRSNLPPNVTQECVRFSVRFFVHTFRPRHSAEKGPTVTQTQNRTLSRISIGQRIGTQIRPQIRKQTGHPNSAPKSGT